MALTLRGFNSRVGRRKTGQKEERTGVRQGLGQKHARFEREKGKVWVTGGTKWGLEIKGYSQILGILECHTN